MQSSKSPEKRGAWIGFSFSMRVCFGIVIAGFIYTTFNVSEERALLIGFTLTFFPKLLLLITKSTGKVSFNILEKGLYLTTSLVSSAANALGDILKRIFKKK